MQIKVKKGNEYRLGVWICDKGYQISFSSNTNDCGVILFDIETKEEYQRIAFPSHKVGKIHSMYLDGIVAEKFAYCFYEDTQKITDIRAKQFLNTKAYGKEADEVMLALFPKDDFKWDDELRESISYEDSIIYCLHVRGFTKHNSSKVVCKGTFLGVKEKIPYLKELGVTTLEFQPFYEFNEINKPQKEMLPFLEKDEKRLNYWGYQEGYYYCPKNAYAYEKDAIHECKDMINTLHKEGFEVIMQFFFPNDCKVAEIVNILRFWVENYHIDGFRLIGKKGYAHYLMEEDSLSGTKIWLSEEIDRNCKYDVKVATYQDDFRNEMRKYLKGDDDCIKSVMHHILDKPSNIGKINYLTNFDGFTLFDLVSYERKHNESNGENNKDGNDYNLSWNCGQEGKSRKKNVVELRMKQMKNAWILLLLSQGTPLFFMGDEFCNSQEGNNNPYCQDNAITWLDWSLYSKNKEMIDFVKKLIAFRKAHPVFHQLNTIRMMDYGGMGFPDASIHGHDAWKADFSPYVRQIGIMYCGKYAYINRKPDDYFFVAYNMHWEEYEFALPRLPKGLAWKLIEKTDVSVKYDKESNLLNVPNRSICVMESYSVEEKE